MNVLAIIVLIIGIAIGMAIIAFAFRVRQIEKGEQPPAAPSTVTPPPPAPTADPGDPAPSWLASLTENLKAPMATLATSVDQSMPAALKKEPDLPELARLYVAPTGHLIIEINGHRFNHITEITDPAIARSLKTMIEELNRFFGAELLHNASAPSAAPTPPQAPTPPMTSPPPVTPLPSPAPTPPPAPDGNVKFISLEEAKQIPLEKPSADIFTQYRKVREREKQPEIRIKTPLDEIDELLQAKIAGTEFMQRGFKVTTAPDGLALFMLDGQSYHSVEEIADASARATMQEVIQAWEQGKR